MTPREWLRQLFNGMCMGACDIIPGISGGTIAFIMGFYEDLLHSIKSVRLPLKNIAVGFLSATLIGIGISLVTLANSITYILDHEVYRIYLYALFLGLIVASTVFCAREIKTWRPRYILALFLGAITAYILCTIENPTPEVTYEVFLEKSPAWKRPIANYDTGKNHLLGLTEGDLSAMLAKGYITENDPIYKNGSPLSLGAVVLKMAPSWFDPWIAFCGILGISALLLPGVSGSYILNILGMYPIVIAALAEFILTFDKEAFLILANLGIGIVIGALIFSRVVSWCLDHYHQTTLSLLTGFLIGSLGTVWPFWSYDYLLNPLKIEAGPKLHVLKPILPPLDFQILGISLLLALSGFALVFVLESLAVKKKKIN